MNKKLLLSLILVANGTTAQESASNHSPSREIERIEIKQFRQPYRGNVPLVQTPQAVDTISSELLESESITRFMEALELTPSVVRQNNSGGMFDSFAIRGFSGDENNPSGYLVNGFNSRGYNGNRSTANIESIEVMKGPGSALYGQGEPGGTINIITKKPQFEEQGYIQATFGNYSKKQFEFDYTNSATKETAYRLNGAYENSDTHRDHISIKSLHLSPSILWNISDDTSLSYEMEVLNQKKPLDRGVYILNNNFDDVNTDAFYGDIRDGAHQVEALGHQLVLNHRLSDDWHILTGFAYRDSSFEGVSSDTELSDGRQLIYTDASLLSRQRRARDYQALDVSARIELSGEIEFGSVKHNILVGVDHYNFDIDTDYKVWRTAWGSGDTTYSINPNNPDYTQTQPEPVLKTLTEESQKGLGIYAQNLIELTEKSKVLVGVRVDKFEQDILNLRSDEAQSQEQTEFTPRLGFIYNANDKVNLYTSYAEGFRPNPGLDSNRNAFEPEETKSFEIGAKWQGIADRFSGSIALFDAQKTNMLTAEPDTGLSATLGEVESQGIEFQLTTELTDETVLALAYTYTDAKTANDVINADWGVPIPKGSRLINIADHIGHVSLKHYTTFLGKESYLGATVNYVGERLGETTDANFILPSYTLVNLSASVELNDKVSVKLDINNLFDKTYFENSYHKLWTMPGSPTTYSASVKYQF
ncbi:TonB-dependent siderophore receptor [Pseudoalteromonas piscicida]|uniref:Iron complex outermembrane recepter protein n=1 Tax=Pseudoalteromonas piscicida TaxID=43662 RepID=A0ABM6NKN8_PSEO7|nr:TonB-dependent siderophore receptor [Pseudoalteromonas piscicida]ATD09598.1 iron complex outermembrane recepter protein [Pseudoalteromonas piscicida]WPU31513.1 TonB-dependent siderophore receptor [Pseudoalteromonas piscicida]